MDWKRVGLWANRGARGALWLAVGLAALGVVAEFFASADRHPYLSVDDALASVSLAVEEQGRLGFFASPLQAPTNDHRHDRFFNYGPWYFYIGAALIWLFDFSVLLIRAIHPLGLLTICLLGAWFFRDTRHGIVGAGFAWLLLYIFRKLHWPMVRPDIAVSVFVALFFLASARGLQTRGRLTWFLAGLCASCGAFSHLMVWSLVPTCVAVLFVGAWLCRWEKRQWIAPTCACGLGGVFGALQFFFLAGISPLEYFGWLQASRSALDSTSPGFTAVLLQHLQLAFGALELWSLWLIAALLGAGFLLAVCRSSALLSEARVPNLILPPFLALVLHLLTRGTYNNYHSGYSIFLHVSLSWLTAAVGWCLFTGFAKGAPRASAGLSFVGCIVIIACSVRLFDDATDPTSFRRTAAARNTPISEFLAAAHHSIPDQARGWGSVFFGIEAPRRHAVLQFGEGRTLLGRCPPERRAELAPDVIYWGYPENRDFTRSLLRGDAPTLGLHELTPGFRYDLISVVHAPPYGVTRIYWRRPAQDAALVPEPALRAYDPEAGRWDTRLGAEIPTVWEAAPAPQLTTLDGPVTHARDTKTAELEAGRYVLEVEVAGPAPATLDTCELLIARLAGAPTDLVMTELGFPFDSAVVFGESVPARLILTHDGGRVQVAFFGAEGRTIGAIRVRPIVPLEVESQDRILVDAPVPAIADWQIPEDVRRGEGAPGPSRILGNATKYGYQIVSPEIPVTPRARVRLQPELEVHQGTVSLGVLDEKGRWLVPASSAAPGSGAVALDFATGHNESVRLVVANLNEAEARVASEFSIEPGSYQCYETGSVNYTDQLFEKAAPANSDSDQKP